MSDASFTAKASPRDLRLDVFRGLCLVMIFMNHIPGTVYEHLTSRNFGFSDAAEGFVFMSGIAAGLAYSVPFRAGFSWPAIGRVWRRAWTLYLVHAMTTLLALGILSYGVMFMGAEDILSRNGFGTYLTRPVAAHIGLPLLLYQIGYVNILPMYMVMLLVAPLLLWAAIRRPMLTWALSGLLWFCAGTWYWNLPNYPYGGGWFFNPIAWQFVFSSGLLTGVAMKSGRRFIPVMRWLQVLTGAYLLLALANSQSETVMHLLGQTLWTLQEAGVPRIFTAFDKTFVTGPRLFHILALGYFLSTFPAVRRFCGTEAMQPLALLGRNALPVFALGSMLALVGQVTKAAYPASFALDSALVVGGLAVQFIFARVLEFARLPR